MSYTKLKLSPATLKFVLNWAFPPWMGAGVRIQELSNDFKYAKVVMPLRIYNRNYVGTHFGGSLYSMCDPVYMLQLLNILGSEFIVWDMAASIKYNKPGRGAVYADFVIHDELIASLKMLAAGEKKVIDLPVEVKDHDYDVVATIIKTLYIKRKQE